MQELLAKLGKYILEKNKIQRRRQRARSKVGYYEKLFAFSGGSITDFDHIRGYKKWCKPGKKNQLRILVKKFKIEQMQAEVELHELCFSNRKTIGAIRKILKSELTSSIGSNYTIGVRLKQDHGVWKGFIGLEELEKIVLDQDAEDILLRG